MNPGFWLCYVAGVASGLVGIAALVGVLLFMDWNTRRRNG